MSSRRLAAIMFTDIAGFTALMEKDEKATRDLVNKYRETLEACVLKFNGEVLRHLGDGSLVIFQSAVEAVRCANEAQKEWQRENVISVKIGIHIGDVVLEGDDIYGDGVNIASRVETLAVGGSILLTDRVIPEIKGHPEFAFQSLGMFHFKNVSRPTEVFALKSPGLPIPKRSEIEGKLEPGKRTDYSIRRNITLWGISFLVIATFVFILLNLPNQSNDQREKSLAVLPFSNLSEETSTDYFCDGVMEDILNRLSYVQDLKVISRTSSIQYRNTTKKSREIATELGVKYIVEGSVRRNLDQIRIVATLIDAMKDEQLWSKSYDRELRDIFDIQSEVANQIVLSLESELTSEAITELNKKPTNNPEAYRLYLKARHDFQTRTWSFEEIIDDLQRALLLDPDFHEAKAELAHIIFRQGYYGLKEEHLAFPMAGQIANEVIEVYPNSVRAHMVLGQLDWFYRRWESAIHHMKFSLEINPNDADTYDQYSEILAYVGDFSTAIKMSQTAVDLNPLSYLFHTHLGEILAFAGAIKAAEKQFEKVKLLFPEAHPHEEAELFIAGKRYNKAIEIYQEMWDLAPEFGRFKLGHLSTLYALSGESEKAIYTRRLIDKSNIEYYSAMGLSYIGTDQLDSTFHYLNLALDRYEGNASMLLCQPIFKLIMLDPRFGSLIDKAGLKRYWNRVSL